MACDLAAIKAAACLSGIAKEQSQIKLWQLIAQLTCEASEAGGGGTVTSVGVASTDLSVSGSPVTSSGDITLNLVTSGISAGTYSGLTINNKGIATAGTTRSFTNNASRTIQTVAAAANGWQISASRDSDVRYSVTITTAVQIGVVTNVEGTVVLEVAATNSASAAAWQEIGRTTQSQDVSLAVAFANTAKQGDQICGYVPAGFFVRLRSINTAGTPTFAYNSGQETIL